MKWKSNQEINEFIISTNRALMWKRFKEDISRYEQLVLELTQQAINRRKEGKYLMGGLVMSNVNDECKVNNPEWSEIEPKLVTPTDRLFEIVEKQNDRLDDLELSMKLLIKRLKALEASPFNIFKIEVGEDDD